MLQTIFTKQFRKDVRRIQRRGKSLVKLRKIVDTVGR